MDDYKKDLPSDFTEGSLTDPDSRVIIIKYRKWELIIKFEVLHILGDIYTTWYSWYSRSCNRHNVGGTDHVSSMSWFKQIIYSLNYVYYGVKYKW